MSTWQPIANLKGQQGNPGPAGTSFIWRGAWSSATAYAVNDVVSFNGSTYICISANTNHDPTDVTRWALMAQQGGPGSPGSPGTAGPNPYGTLASSFTPP